jgi:hypothetical protein
MNVNSNDRSRDMAQSVNEETGHDGPYGRWDEPAMERHNDRVSRYDTDDEKRLGLELTGRRYDDGFGWIESTLIEQFVQRENDLTLQETGRPTTWIQASAEDVVEVRR